MQIPISRNEGTMAGTAQHPDTAPHSDVVSPRNRRGRHVHHGRTAASWIGSAIAMLAFIVGGIAIVVKNQPLFWVSVGLAVVAIIAAVVLQRLGYGAN
jgi:hypothetical protein